MTADNPITSTIALNRDGVRHGFLCLPYSSNLSAWGAVMIPLTVMQNGAGPTALLTGASHGDEYEGPVALQDLAVTLQPAAIQGRVIIVPAFNYPAFRAGRRNSPIDSGNLNRAFPGDPKGSVTEKIADYFLRMLVPQADLVLDIRSGGESLEFVPLAAVHLTGDSRQQAACVAAMEAFNAPFSVILKEIDNAGMYDTAVENAGKTFVTTELGGTTRPQSIAIAKKGIANVLIHAGILNARPMAEPSIRLQMPDSAGFVVSEHDGLLEPIAGLGPRWTKTMSLRGSGRWTAPALRRLSTVPPAADCWPAGISRASSRLETAWRLLRAWHDALPGPAHTG